jgi:hypothetical protein
MMDGITELKPRREYIHRSGSFARHQRPRRLSWRWSVALVTVLSTLFWIAIVQAMIWALANV